MNEENVGEIVFMKGDVEREIEKAIKNIRELNFRGSGTRFLGVVGDIQRAFGLHAPEAGQPRLDSSVTDLDLADFLDKVIPEIGKSGVDMDKRIYEDLPESTPREMEKWMKKKRDKLRGIEEERQDTGTEEEKSRSRLFKEIQERVNG